MKPQTIKKKKKSKKEKEIEGEPTDKELQKQLFPSLAIPNDPDIARVSCKIIVSLKMETILCIFHDWDCCDQFQLQPIFFKISK